MSKIIVLNSLVVSLKVLEDRSSVEEKVRVGLLQVLFSLGVRLEGQFKLVNLHVIDEKIGQVCIS